MGLQVTKQQPSVVLNNESILRSGKYSDFMITAGGYEFKVHRNIICPGSPFLERLCDSNFKVFGLTHFLAKEELTFVQEAQDGHAKLNETDAIVFEKLLFHLYTGDFTNEHEISIGKPSNASNSEPSDPSNISEEVLSLVLYEKPSTPSIGPDNDVTDNQAEEYFEQEFQTFHLNYRLNILADFCGIQALKNEAFARCKELLNNELLFWCCPPKFVTIIEEVVSCTSPADELRQEVIRKCAEGCSEHPVACHELESSISKAEPKTWRLAKDLAGKEKENKTLRTALEKSKRDVTREAAKLTTIQETLSQYSECRNHACNREFACNVELTRGYTPFIRCASCGCKHK